MPHFVANDALASPRQMLALAAGVNAALRGETASTGTVFVPAGADAVTVRDERCRAGRLAVLIPLDRTAAGARWWLDSMGRHAMTFRFPEAPGACAFGWAILGDGAGTGGE